MKILWITNILFPEAQALLEGEGELRSSGGWMIAAASRLLQVEDIDLYVVSISNKVREITKLQGEKIFYFIIPYGNGNKKINQEYEPIFKAIQQHISPDIVHIHGTEYSHGLAYIRACGLKNVVVSIQGLLSEIYHYYHYGLSMKDIILSTSVRDIIKGGIIKDKNSFKVRSEYEREILCNTKHIIGRTTWDKSHVLSINPNAQYYFCNETLRPEFYTGKKWDYNNCDKYTIFISQASYPLKGLHQLLKAMPLVIKHYPNARIRIAGPDILKHKGIAVIFQNGYGRYITKLIHKLNLTDHVTFIGSLDSIQIKNEYLKANVFICPSSIENSPNSLGEAQILGVPCLASFVGGVPDMMNGNEDCLYRFEDYEMLAYKICEVFSKVENNIDMIDIAKNRHDPKTNADCLINIYKSIISSQN